jgi:hypothetical protein
MVLKAVEYDKENTCCIEYLYGNLIQNNEGFRKDCHQLQMLPGIKLQTRVR